MHYEPQNQNSLTQQIDVKKLRFKANTDVISTREILSTSFCNICFKFHELKTNRLRKYEEPGQDMLLCYGCGVTVHHYCYGLKTPYNDVPNDSEYKLRMFVCDKCLYLGPNFIQGCAICSQSGKALKRTTDNKYVHIMCLLFSKDYRVVDFETMEIEPNYNYISLSKRNKTVCEFCEEANPNIHCDHHDCKNVCHAYCAWLNKINFLYEDEESALGWRMAFLPEANTNTLSLDTLQLRVKDRIEKTYSFINEALQGNVGNNEKILEETLKDIRKEVKEALTYYSEFTESNEGEKDVVLSECQEHRNPELFCVCKSPYDQSRFMFACDTCENWFHPECLEIDPILVTDLKNYFCKRCQHWTTIRLQCFQPEIQVELETPLETKDPSQIIPQDTRFFWVMDYIVSCIIFQRKAFKALSNFAEFKQSLKELLQSLKFIPFKLDAMVVNVLSQYFAGMAIDKALKCLLDSENAGNISQNTEDLKEEDFTKEKVEGILKIIEDFEKIIALYEAGNLPKGNVVDSVFSLLMLNKWKLDFYKQFMESGKKIVINDIKLLDERADEYGIENTVPERRYLKRFQKAVENLLNRAKNIVENGKSMCERSKANKNTKISSEGVGLEKAFEMLQEETNRLKEDIGARVLPEKIMTMIEQATVLGLEFGEDIEALSKEIKKAESLSRGLTNRVTSFEKLQEKIAQIGATFIKLPDAEKIVDEYSRVKKVKLRLEYYARVCCGGEKSADVDMREVQQMLKEVKELGIFLGKEDDIVRKKVNQIKELEAKIEVSMEDCADLEGLNALLNEAEAFHIKFSKIDDIKRRIGILSELKKKLEKNTAGKTLTTADSHSDYSKEGLCYSVDLKEEAFEVSDNSSGRAKIPYKATPKPEETDALDMDGSDENTQFSFLWLRSLTEFFENHAELNNSDDSTHHSGVTNNNLESELKRFPLEPLNDENINQIIRNNFNEFREIIHRGINIDLSDQRIANIFFIHADEYWNLEIALLFSGSLCLNENDFLFLEQLAGKLDNYKPVNEYNKKYKDIFVEYYQWIAEYKAVVASEFYTGFLNGQSYSEQQTTSLEKYLSSLLEKSRMLKVEVDEEQDVLKQTLGHLKWVATAKNLLKNIKDGKKIDYDKLKSLFVEANLLRIPSNCAIYSQISHVFKEQTALKEKYERFNLERNQIRDKINQISQGGPARKVNILRELSELSKQKPCFKRGVQIMKEIKEKGCIIISSDEFGKMEKDINLCISWQEQAKKFLEKYKLEDNEHLEEKRINEIGCMLNEVTNSMGELVLQDHEMEQAIHVFEWRFHAKLLLNGKERQKSETSSEGTTVWKRLLKHADKKPELKLQGSQLYKLVKEQVDTYEDLMVKISIIKEHDLFVNQSVNNQQYLRSARKGLMGHLDLKMLVEKLCNCRINAAPEARDYLVGLLNKLFEIKTAAEDMKSKLKELKDVGERLRQDLQRLYKLDADGLLRRIYTLPIRLDESEEFLEAYLEGRLEKVEKNEKIKRMQFMEEERKKREGVLNGFKGIKSQIDINEKIDIFDDVDTPVNKQVIEIPVIEIKDDDVQEKDKENNGVMMNVETDLRRVESTGTVLERNTSAHYNLAESVDDNKRTSIIFEDEKTPSVNDEEQQVKKLKVKSGVGKNKLVQSEVFDDAPVKVSNKARSESKQKIMTALRETKKFEGIKVHQREGLTKKFEKSFYEELQGDQAKYKQKVNRLCQIIDKLGSNFEEATALKMIDSNIDEDLPLLETSHSLPNINLTKNSNSSIIPRQNSQNLKRSKSNITSLDSIPESSLSNTDKQSDAETPKRVSTRSHSNKAFPSVETVEGNSENDVEMKNKKQTKRKKNNRKSKEEPFQGTLSIQELDKAAEVMSTMPNSVFPVVPQGENAGHPPPQYLAIYQQKQIEDLALCLPEDKKQKILTGLSKISQSFTQNGTPITHDISQSPSPLQNPFAEPPKPVIQERSTIDSAYIPSVTNAKLGLLMQYYQKTPARSTQEKQDKSSGMMQDKLPSEH